MAPLDPHPQVNWSRIVRAEFWYGWLWGVCVGISLALVVYFGVEAWRVIQSGI